MNKCRHRFIIDIDSGNRAPGFILERRERPPLVDDQRWRFGSSRRDCYTLTSTRATSIFIAANSRSTGTASMSPNSVDEYIASFAPEVRTVLEKVRTTVRKAAPGATERISYRMPAFRLGRDLVYFGAFKSHIGFYPPVRDKALKKAAAIYAGEKGNLRFPLDEPIPYTLISRIVKARVREVQQTTASRKKR